MLKPQTFRKKPIAIRAIQWTGEHPLAVLSFATGARLSRDHVTDDLLIQIDTLEGTLTAQPGDWIIQGVNGEFYPCKPDIFAKTYEAVVPEPESGATDPGAAGSQNGQS